MAETFEQYKARMIKETLDFHGVSKWHEMGYKGQGITFLELESNNVHCKNVKEVFNDIAPESIALNAGVSYRVTGGVLTEFKFKLNDGTYIYEFDEVRKWIESNNVDIIGVSMSGEYHQEVSDFFKSTGCILVNSAGNDGESDYSNKFNDDGFSVAAITLKNGEIEKEYYSSVHTSVDFGTLHCAYEGTSFASPTLAGIIALIMSRYSKMCQDEMKKVLMSMCIDAGDIGHDTSFGWGVPVLPERIEMLEESSMYEKLYNELLDKFNSLKHKFNDLFRKYDNLSKGTFTVMYAHLDKIYCKEGETVNADLPWRAAVDIGKMGNTGSSTGAHLHIAVVEGKHPELWHLADMNKAEYRPSRQQLDYFADDTLFDTPIVFTNGWLGYKNHYAYDAVPRDRHETSEHYTIKWNRRFAGRVLKTGFDSAYGNYVLVYYSTLPM